MAQYQQHSLSRPLPSSVVEGESEALTVVLALIILAVGGSLYLLV
jgi:hypothetical protein